MTKFLNFLEALHAILSETEYGFERLEYVKDTDSLMLYRRGDPRPVVVNTYGNSNIATLQAVMAAIKEAGWD